MAPQGSSENNGREEFARNYGGPVAYNHFGSNNNGGRAATSSNWRASATPVGAGLGSNLARVGGANLVPIYSTSVRHNNHLSMSMGIPRGSHNAQSYPATPSSGVIPADAYATAMGTGSGIGPAGSTAGHNDFLALLNNSGHEAINGSNHGANNGVTHGADLGDNLSGMSSGHGYSTSMGNTSSAGHLSIIPSHSTDVASLNSLRGPSFGPNLGTGYASAGNQGSTTSPFAVNSFPMNYAYCIRRPNGSVVPLVPTDLLPPLRDIPSTIHDPRNVTLLPVLAGLAPNGRSFYLGEIEVADKHSHIDSLVARAGPSNANSRQSQKRQKIYCDKWVHDGTCAFTQQGCKFKHEMPFDKSTQHELGLFHGLPNWWKKQQSELQRQQDLQSIGDQPIDLGHAVNTLSRRNATSAGSSPGQMAYSRLLPGPKHPISNDHGHNSAAQFGVIGTGRGVGASHAGQGDSTPTRSISSTVRGGGIVDHNRFATLSLEETTMDEDGSEDENEGESGAHVATRENPPASTFQSPH